MPLYAIGHCNSDTEMFRPVPRVVVALVALALAVQLSAEEHGQSRSHTLPLSDLANRGNWSVYEPMTDEFSGDTLNPAKWFSHSRQYTLLISIHVHPSPPFFLSSTPLSLSAKRDVSHHFFSNYLAHCGHATPRCGEIFIAHCSLRVHSAAVIPKVCVWPVLRKWGAAHALGTAV